MLKIILILVITTILALSSAQAEGFECGFDPDSIGSILYISPDTVFGLAIYCCYDTLPSYTLPDYAYAVWDSTEQRSVPGYYMDMTDRKVIFLGDVWEATVARV
jgi:hypothetical protein